MIQYKVVSPEIIYTQGTLNRLSKLYLHICATYILVIKEAVELRGSGGAREGWEEGTWERLVGGRERGNDTITFSLNFSKNLKKQTNHTWLP